MLLLNYCNNRTAMAELQQPNCNNRTAMAELQWLNCNNRTAAEMLQGYKTMAQ